MKNNLKKVLKGILLWSLAMSTLLGSSVFAADIPVGVRNSRSLVDKAARLQVLANGMKKCIKYIPGYPEIADNPEKSQRYNLFNGVSGVDYNVYVGAWVEDQIDGNKDGKIVCYQGNSNNNVPRIVTLFAEELGLTVDQILCNKDHPDQPGLIARYEGGSCIEAAQNDNTKFEYNYWVSPDSMIYGSKYATGEYYLKALYNHAKAKNPYFKDWERIDDFTGGSAYYALFNDFKALCGGAEMNGPNGDNIVTLKELTDEGKVVTKYYQYNSSSGKAYSTTGNTERSCGDFQSAIMEHFEEYKAQFNSAAIESCKKSEDLKREWTDAYENALEVKKGSPEDYSEEDLNQADETIKTYNKIHRTTTQIVGYDDEGRPKVEPQETWEPYEENDDGVIQCIPAPGTVIVVEPYEEPDYGTSTEAEPSCANSGAAGSLGWIVCPLLDWMGNATEKIYADYVAPALMVDARLFTNDSDNIAKAWGTFQNIANIFFVIFLLIVIFSQLTGVGIDNYGIKKILPKLIIAAVLVNLSYIICTVCVDLSNILGTGLKSLFDNLPVGAPQVVIDGSPLNIDNAVGGLVTVGVVLALVGGIWAIISNPAILMTLFVGVIGVLISIFFLFILLSARQAAIVVLVVISPIAFVCYMLPNTKKLFDKYLKMWEGLLLVYPIAGLLVGGGNYISRLLLSSGFGDQGLFSAFSAMIVGIVPIFFIPTVLKSSFAAMGSLGAKISGMGQRLSGGAQRRMKNSERYRNAQKLGLERRNRLRAGIDSETGMLTKRGERKAARANQKTGVRGLYNRVTGASRRQASLIEAARKNIGAGEAAGAELTSALAKSGIPQSEALALDGEEMFAAGTEGAYYGNQFVSAASRGDIQGMNSSIEAMKKSGMKPKDITKLLRRAQDSGLYDNLDKDTRAAWMRELSQKHGDILANDFEFQHFARNGGGEDGAKLGAYGEYATAAKIEKSDLNPDDVLKLSGDSLAGLAAAGIIDKSMASAVMAKNPNLSSDKKIMLGALASGAANADTIKNNGGADQFKKDADTLDKDSNDIDKVSTMNIEKADQVDAWKSAKPQDVNVVQNFSAGGRQHAPVRTIIEGSGELDVHGGTPTASGGTPAAPTSGGRSGGTPAAPTSGGRS